MSWFRHKPKPKNPPVNHPKEYSPASQKMLEEAKKTGPTKQKKGSG